MSKKPTPEEVLHHFSDLFLEAKRANGRILTALEKCKYDTALNGALYQRRLFSQCLETLHILTTKKGKSDEAGRDDRKEVRQ